MAQCKQQIAKEMRRSLKSHKTILICQIGARQFMCLVFLDSILILEMGQARAHVRHTMFVWKESEFHRQIISIKFGIGTNHEWDTDDIMQKIIVLQSQETFEVESV